MKKMIVKLTGIVPMLMHSDLLADPLNPATIEHKEVSSKRKKTEADHLWLGKSEWKNSMYFDEDGNISVPCANVKATLMNGAKLNKLGTAVKRAVLIVGTFGDFSCPGVGNLEKMWDSKKFLDVRSVKVGTAKIMRYRPKFTDWSLTVDVVFDDEQIGTSELKQCFENAGNFIGLGDFRPTFGLFNCKFMEV